MIPILSDLKSLIQNPRKNKSYLQHNKRNQNKKRKEKEKNAHEFFDDSLVNKDGNSNAEDSDKSKITTSPTKIVLKIFSSRSPFFYEFVLWCFHSTSHFCTLFISLSSPNSRVEDLLVLCYNEDCSARTFSDEYEYEYEYDDEIWIVYKRPNYICCADYGLIRLMTFSHLGRFGFWTIWFLFVEVINTNLARKRC